MFEPVCQPSGRDLREGGGVTLSSWWNSALRFPFTAVHVLYLLDYLRMHFGKEIWIWDGASVKGSDYGASLFSVNITSAKTNCTIRAEDDTLCKTGIFNICPSHMIPSVRFEEHKMMKVKAHRIVNRSQNKFDYSVLRLLNVFIVNYQHWQAT